MVEPGEGAGLGQVLLNVLGTGDPLRVEDLDRHGAVKLVIAGQIDTPESPLAELPDYPVAADCAGIAERRSLGFGGRGRDDPRARGRLLRQAQLALQGLQFGPQCRPALVGDVDHIVLDVRLAPRPPVGFESPADLINAAGRVDVQAAEVVAGSVAHLDLVFGPKLCTAPLSPTALIDDDWALATRQDRCRSTSGRLDFVR